MWSCGGAAWLAVRGSRKELVSPSAPVFGPDSGAGVVGVRQSSGRGASDIRAEQGGPGAAAAAAEPGPGAGWGWTPALLRPLPPPQEQPWRVLEGRWERNSRANSELAEQTAADVKQSRPVLLKLSKYCVRPAAGNGACPSHQVERYQRADIEQPGEAGEKLRKRKLWPA